MLEPRDLRCHLGQILPFMYKEFLTPEDESQCHLAGNSRAKTGAVCRFEVLAFEMQKTRIMYWMCTISVAEGQGCDFSMASAFHVSRPDLTLLLFHCPSQ